MQGTSRSASQSISSGSVGGKARTSQFVGQGLTRLKPPIKEMMKASSEHRANNRRDQVDPQVSPLVGQHSGTELARRIDDTPCNGAQ